ncbi:MAG: 7-cyano-7-deazaguanine synthase QueC [Robiginitomaculum sp.]|nr:MAG: 7-cyano-7-deazaguanine synthase QueC [Robiginitomaculum sp.]
MRQQTTALVLYSGGQDSCVCLADALARYENVETIGFLYGQAHAIEMQTRLVFLQKYRETFCDQAKRLGPDHVLDISGYGEIAQSTLTVQAADTRRKDGLPATYVPGRNLIFLIAAAALADRRGAEVLVGGMCETDYSGYPDCRRETMDAVETTIRLGMGLDLRIDTPLMALTKAQTWELTERLGGQKLVDLIVTDSHSCYAGDREHLHKWGYGCGQCDACKLRAKGYESWANQQEDGA